MADSLRRAGVARVFVVPGCHQAVARALAATPLQMIDAADAPSAITMAAITGQLGDAPGVALIGDDAPGVSTSLAEAERHHAPMIVLADAEPRTSAPRIKTIAVASADSVAHWSAHAGQAAMNEPPGPVWLVVAPDVATRPALPVATVTRPPVVPIDISAVDAVAERLAGAARPLIIAGRECRVLATASWLRALAEALPAPVLVTRAARGALPDPHPLCFGVLAPDAAILGRADVVLALGVDARELDGVRLETPLLRLGRTEAERPAVAEARGDVVTLLEELAPRLRDRRRADWDVAELDRLRRARGAPDVVADLGALITQLREATPAGTILVVPESLEDASALWLAVNPGEVLVSDAVIAAATAAALARPDNAVVGIVADSSTVRVADLAAASDARVPVITVVVGADASLVERLRGSFSRTAVAASPSAVALAVGAALTIDGPTVVAMTGG